MRMGLLWVVAGVLACTSSSSPAVDAEKPAAEPERSAAECAAKVAKMRALFAHGSPSPIVISLPEGGRFPASRHGRPIEDGIPVFIAGDSTYRFDNRTLTAEELKASLEEEFDKARQLAELTGRPMTGQLFLAADARARVDRLLEVVALVPADMRFALVVDLEGDVVPEGPKIPEAVRVVFEEAAADTRSQKLAELLQPSALTCPPLGKVFEEVAAETTPSDRRGDVLLAGLPGAVEACGCAVDFDTLFAVTWNMSGKTTVEQRQMPLPVTADPKAEAVEMAVDATVEALVKVLEGRGDRPFRVVQK